MQKSLYFIFVFICILGACRSTYTPSEFPDAHLRFGSGGGMTGAVSTWHLLENGQLFFQQTAKSEMIDKGRVPRKAAKAVFAQATELGVADADIMQPGNMYQFVEMQTGDATGKATWGDAKADINPDFKTLYQALMALTK